MKINVKIQSDYLAVKEGTQEFSVSEISYRIKQIIECNFDCVRIRGEISGFKLALSGHGYFNLKDSKAVLGCTYWRSAISKLKFEIIDGLEVVVIGKITTYSGQSKYQLNVEYIEPYGVGSLMKILEQRKEQLGKEGLFKNKKAIPFLSDVIGVITSLTGAVLRDIIHRINGRFPTRVVVWPVSVQGNTSANEVSKAIEGFNKELGELRPDVIIVARGGGSIEDLWAFNEEIVVRSTAASKIPIISAIGHETDFTLIDFASDLRAPTPSAAAEFATPVLSELMSNIENYIKTLQNKCSKYLSYKESILKAYQEKFLKPVVLLRNYEQKLDYGSMMLNQALPGVIKLKIMQLKQFNVQFLNPKKSINMLKLRLLDISNQLQQQMKRYFDAFDGLLKHYEQFLSTINVQNTLKRGFCIVKDNQENIIVSAQNLQNKEKISITFQDGQARADIVVKRA